MPNPTLPFALDLIGVSVFAVSGALAAGRKRLDLVGVVVLGLVTAVGGGTIRDLLLDRNPIFWIANPAYVIAITASALLTVVYARWRRPPQKALLVADALGLALFSMAGALIAEQSGVHAVIGIVLGTVTGSAGGAVRDVLCAEIPLVLRRGNLYATAAVAGTGLYFLLAALSVARDTAAVIGVLVTAGVRFASIWWNLQLPVFQLDQSRVTADDPDDS